MALLQITEPGQVGAREHRCAVGIDLGTTNTLAAAVRDGLPQTLSAAVPSLVHYRADAAPLVGDAARGASLEDPANTVVSVKRLMGRGADDLAHLPEWFGYRLNCDNPGVPRLQTAAGDKSAVEVSADILREIKRLAEKALGAAPDGAVITVPAYFDDAQRQATKDAARLAGLEVYRLINEPTAAAVAYGLDRGADEELIAVFDFGGGTLDVSVLQLDKGVLRVLATGGDSLLGGDDFDRALADWLAAQAPASAAFARTPRTLRHLLAEARRAKEALSAERAVECRLSPPGCGEWRTELPRAQFEQLAAPLADKAVAVCRRVLLDAGVQPAQVQNIVMVGGSTRMPLVRARVAEFFGRELLTDIDPDEVVALGAAVQADTLAGNRAGGDEMLLLDVVPLSLGIETMGGLAEKIIPRNSVIPAARAQEFTTAKDGQTGLSLHVVQGERPLVSDCRSLARFELKGIEPRKAGAARIEVTFRVDADGLLSVEAEEAASGARTAVEVKPSYGLSDDEVERMILDSAAHAGQDMQARKLREVQVEGRRVVDALMAALAEDGDELLDAAGRAPILDAGRKLEDAIGRGDADSIRAAIERLEACSESYVARRMNRGIRRALAGRSAGEFG